MTLIFYKLVFVLFKDFRDLGYNAKGITSTLKAASKIARDKNLDSLTDTIDTMPMKNKVNEVKKSKIRYKKNSLGNKVPFVLLLIAMVFSCKTNHFAYAPSYRLDSRPNTIVECLNIPKEHVQTENQPLNQDIRVK